jgi:nitrate reductase assembly molybdenum cofactor insertion protein NarJ
MQNKVYLYKLLSELLSYPDAKGWELMEEMFQYMDLLSKGEFTKPLHDFKDYMSKSSVSLEELQSEYLSFFDMGGVVSPYESEYVREKISRKPTIIADIAGFYKAFGFEVQGTEGYKEVLDHISVELEFMAILYLKKLDTQEQNDPEKTEIVDDAVSNFLKDHLAGWGLFYCSLIQESNGPVFYKKTGNVLATLLQEEVKEHSLNLDALQRGIVRPAAKKAEKEGLSCGPMAESET